MNDKHRLSSEQALDDYFFDLLAEPEELETAEEKESAVDNDESASHPVDMQSAEVSDQEPVLDEHTQKDEFAAVDGAGADEVAAPFDFEQLSECDEQSGAAISVELDLLLPSSKASSWVPQTPEEPTGAISVEAVPVKAMPVEAIPTETVQAETIQVEARPTVSFAEQPQAELDGVQRLLSQMSQMQSDIQQETDAQVTVQAEAAVDAIEQEAEEATVAEPMVRLDTEQVQPEPERVVDVEPELEKAEPEGLVAPQTLPGGDEPPDVWQQQQERDADFQALFFEVNGVTFAVPLTELGGIHQLGDVNHLLGRPPWYLGLMTNREHQLDVVDTARWVMPEKLSSNEHQEEYRYIVMLGESKWGLACNALHGTETLTEQSVRWREQAGKRPWLAGMVKEKMCALIHVNELISMLNAGLDVKSVM